MTQTKLMTSRLISKLTGEVMKANQYEFRAWNFPYRVGEVYDAGEGLWYGVVAVGTLRQEATGYSLMVLVEAC